MFPIPYIPTQVIEDDDEEHTYPPIGSSTLTVQAEEFTLFFSAEWTIRARVNGYVVAESSYHPENPTQATVNRWARAYIRKDADRLTKLGVDVKKEYVGTFGGVDRDL